MCNKSHKLEVFFKHLSLKKYCLLSIILFFTASLKAQLFTESFDPVFSNGNKVLKNALAGGFNQSQFSNFDCNGDGQDDLLVFDRTGNKVMVFISTKTSGLTTYSYEPAYEEFFPEGKEFMRFQDYNNDGKADLGNFYKDTF